MQKIYACKYCDKEYLTNQSRNGHQVHCSLNPNSQSMQQKIKQTIKNNYKPRISKKVQLIKVCNKCGKEYSVYVTSKANQLGRYKKYCSRSCANGRMHSIQTKSIIRKSMTKNVLKSNYCTVCGNETGCKRKTCSPQCYSTYQKQINKGRKHRVGCKTGGFRQKGGHSKVYEYINWLGQTMYLNKEQIVVAKLFDYHKLKWKRNKCGFPYIDINGNNRKFYPDFKVNQTYVQYKGWVTEQMQHKMKDSVQRNQIPLIIVVSGKRFQQYGMILSQFIQKLTSLV